MKSMMGRFSLLAAKFAVLALFGLMAVGCEKFNERQDSGVGERCAAISCTSLGAECGNVDDGCGNIIHCGTCEYPQTCGGSGVDNECGCTPQCEGRCGGNNGCGGQCPDTCTFPETCGGAGLPNSCGCRPDCTDKCGGDDGCGGLCPETCLFPQSCGGGGVVNECGCTPQCTNRCDGPDGCGGTCNTECIAPQSCGGGGVEFVCGCTPACDGVCAGDDSCGAECPDNCEAPLSCGGGLEAMVCGCTPKDCATIVSEAGVSCGVFDDGCGDEIICESACTGAEVCNGIEGACCVPDCSGKVCGHDGCGGQCGSCGDQDACALGSDLFACTGLSICATSGFCAHDRQWTQIQFSDIATVDGSLAYAVSRQGLVYRLGDGGLSVVAQSTSERLLALTALADGKVWAVGERGALLHFDGTSWSETQLALSGGSTPHLYGVHAFASDGVFAVGQAGSIFYFDGSTWTEQATPISGDLYDVHSLSADMAWAVGRSGHLQVRSGGVWSSLDTTTGEHLRAVYANASDDVWVGGGTSTTYLGHWDGSAWSKPIPTAYNGIVANSTVEDIVALSPTDLVAVGAEGLLLRYQGGDWQPDFGGDSGWYGVASTGSDNLWLIGDSGALSRSDGTGLSAVLPQATGTLTEIVTDASGGLWLVQGIGTPPYERAELWYRDSVGSWQEVALPTHAGGGAWLPTAIGVDSADELWIVGHEANNILPAEGLLAHRSGGAWEVVASGDEMVPLYALTWSPDGKLWTGGGGSASLAPLWSYDGATLLAHDVGLTGFIRGLYSPANDSLWIANNGGIHHYDGTTLATESLGVSSTFGSIDGAAADDIWVVENYRLWHFDGSLWTPQALGLSSGQLFLGALAVRASDDAVAVGTNNRGRTMIYEYDGIAWSQVDAPIHGGAFDVAMDATITYMAGPAGLLER